MNNNSNGSNVRKNGDAIGQALSFVFKNLTSKDPEDRKKGIVGLVVFLVIIGIMLLIVAS